MIGEPCSQRSDTPAAPLHLGHKRTWLDSGRVRLSLLLQDLAHELSDTHRGNLGSHRTQNLLHHLGQSGDPFACDVVRALKELEARASALLVQFDNLASCVALPLDAVAEAS